MSKVRHQRCCICNSVSSKDIETNVEDFKDGNFVPDPKNPDIAWICTPCKEWVEELKADYEMKDDQWGHYNYPDEEFLPELYLEDFKDGTDSHNELEGL